LKSLDAAHVGAEVIYGRRLCRRRNGWRSAVSAVDECVHPFEFCISRIVRHSYQEIRNEIVGSYIVEAEQGRSRRGATQVTRSRQSHWSDTQRRIARKPWIIPCIGASQSADKGTDVA
jgi:hypothetical protein